MIAVIVDDGKVEALAKFMLAVVVDGIEADVPAGLAEVKEDVRDLIAV